MALGHSIASSVTGLGSVALSELFGIEWKNTGAASIVAGLSHARRLIMATVVELFVGDTAAWVFTLKSGGSVLTNLLVLLLN